MWFYKRTPMVFWIFTALVGVASAFILISFSPIEAAPPTFWYALLVAIILAHLPVRMSPILSFQGSYAFLFFLVYVFDTPLAWVIAILLDAYITWRDVQERDLRFVAFSAARMALLCTYLVLAREFLLGSGIDPGLLTHFALILGLAVLISLFNWASFYVFGTYRLGRYILATGLTYDLARYAFLSIITFLLVITWEVAEATGVNITFWVAVALIVAIQLVMFAWQSSEERTRHVKRTLVGLIDWRDRYADSRSLDNRNICLSYARYLKWSPGVLEVVSSASLLHDIGKVIVSDSILHKQERLTTAEFDIVKRHVEFGASELDAVPGFGMVADAVRDHHERWDGKGYPGAKEGGEINQVGRLISLSDSFMAMVKSRPFRPGMSRERVLEIIKSELGTQFDPDLGGDFLRFMNRGAEPLEYLVFYPTRL